MGLENKLNTKVKFFIWRSTTIFIFSNGCYETSDLLLLDGHTAALESKTSNVIMQNKGINKKKYSMTTMMISHNMKDAIEYSDRIIMLDKGRKSYLISLA